MRIRNLLVLGFCWALLGCGQTGDLYLPGTVVETIDETPADTDAAEEKEQSE